METLLQDLRYAIRMLTKKPAFTCVALLTLTLGIGANASVFTVVNAVLLHPLPYKNADQLVMVWHNYSESLSRASVSPPAYIEYRDQTKSFENVAAFTNWNVNLTGPWEPERIQGFRATANFFPTLGVDAAIGRTFLPEEDQVGHNRVVVLSSGLWKRRFGSDPNIVGKPITVNGADYNVIGVLPSGFQFVQNVELWTPIAFTPAAIAPRQHGNEYLGVVARTKSNLTIGQAQAEMDTLSDKLRPEFYSHAKKWHVSLQSMRDHLAGDIRPALLILMGAVGFVLLIACTNVANLLLTRATIRQREMAIRTALGASRGRIIRQLITESVILAGIGGVLGLLLAFWTSRLLVIGLPKELAQFVVGSNAIGVDFRILAFTMAISLATGVVFGLVPALQASNPNLNESFKETAGTIGGGRNRLRGFLVVSEIALAIVLLIGAGLLIKSFVHLQTISPGFNSNYVLSMQVSLPFSKYNDSPKVIGFYRQLLQRVSTLPGVQSAGAISNLPLSGYEWNASFIVEGQPTGPGEAEPHGDPRAISPDYFRAMGIPLLKGRYFTGADSESALPVTIVDETLARRYWPNEDPIGKRIAFEGSDENPRWMQIVGVVGHVKHYGLDAESKVQYYYPYVQSTQQTMFVVVHTNGNPLNLTGALKDAVHGIDKDQPIYNITTMDDLLSKSLTQRRFSMMVLTVFAGIALLLAGVGIYGVMAYSVSQRSHEIGIRMALGAQRRDVLKLVISQGMLLTIIGVGTGLVGAFVLTRWITTLLYGISPTDADTFLWISLLIAFVSLVACYIPARRATRLDPVIALRYE